MQTQKPLKRIVVVGCCGAGKSTFAAELARRLDLPYVERDALGNLGSDTYRTAVAGVLALEAWVFDGPPYYVELEVYSAAQVVVWLDYAKPVALCRAVRRSIGRTLRSPKPGEKKSKANRWERIHQWVTPGGPCWTWQTYARRKQEFAALSARPELETVSVLRFGRPAEASVWLDTLCGR
jgi:adenylate kinase family enzyme